MSKKRIFQLWALGLLLSLLAWPPADFSLLILIAYSPFLILAESIKNSKKLIPILYSFYFLLVFIKGFGILLEGNYTLGLLAAISILPLLWMIPILILHMFCKRGLQEIGYLTFPFFYVLNEYWQYYWDLSFTVNNLSFALGNDFLFNDIYPILGTLGISFIIICINSIVAYIYGRIKERSSRKKLKYWSSFIVVLLLSLSLLPFAEETNSGDLKVAVFSPNSEDQIKMQDDMKLQIDFLKNGIHNIQSSSIDLIVGPEGYLNDLIDNPIFTNSIDQNQFIIELQQIVDEKHFSLMIGAVLVELYKSNDFPTSSSKKKEEGLFYDIYNGVIFLTPGEKVQWRSKQVLLPLVEKIPFYRTINFLAKESELIDRLDNTYGVKNDLRPFTFGKLKLVTSICFESFYPLHLEQKVKMQGADLHIVLTNDWTKNQTSIDQYQIYCQAIGKAAGIPTLLATMNEKSVFLRTNGTALNFKGYPLSFGKIDL